MIPVRSTDAPEALETDFRRGLGLFDSTLFYILTIAGVFRLRATRPGADRPYRAFGHPVIPALHIAGAATILTALLIYRPATTWPGFLIVLLGIPAFLWMRRRARARPGPSWSALTQLAFLPTSSCALLRR